MSNPWDNPPLAVIGDADKEATYAGVGHVMTHWEGAEFCFARIYTIFVGDEDGASLAQYGAGRIFPYRLTILSTAADRFFIRKPSQLLEGFFHLLTTSAEGFADRRNDVAHGIVLRIDAFTVFTQKMPPEERARSTLL